MLYTHVCITWNTARIEYHLIFLILRKNCLIYGQIAVFMLEWIKNGPFKRFIAKRSNRLLCLSLLHITARLTAVLAYIVIRDAPSIELGLPHYIFEKSFWFYMHIKVWLYGCPLHTFASRNKSLCLFLPVWLTTPVINLSLPDINTLIFPFTINQTL